jgi:N-acetylglutamate synthase-like GNAT family acetyltransferase
LTRPKPRLRKATSADTAALHGLITSHTVEGRLLPRTLAELTQNADRFIVATLRRRIVGCAELAPLSDGVAEVRSLVVDRAHRGRGLGRRIIEELRSRARREGFDQLCAFGHDPAIFARMGFVMVPHSDIPEKIETDCRRCPLFGKCGQFAMMASLEPIATDTPIDHPVLRV